MSDMTVSLDRLGELLTRILRASGMSPGNADVIAGRIVVAERDRAKGHGLLPLPGHIASLKSGWVNGHATPTVEDTAPGVGAVDAQNGFAQIPLAPGHPPLLAQARANGVRVQL